METSTVLPEKAEEETTPTNTPGMLGRYFSSTNLNNNNNNNSNNSNNNANNNSYNNSNNNQQTPSPIGKYAMRSNNSNNVSNHNSLIVDPEQNNEEIAGVPNHIEPNFISRTDSAHLSKSDSLIPRSDS